MSKNVPQDKQSAPKPVEPAKAAPQATKANPQPNAPQQGNVQPGSKNQPAPQAAQKGAPVAAVQAQKQPPNGKTKQPEPDKLSSPPLPPQVDLAKEERKKQKKALLGMQQAYFKDLIQSIQKESGTSLKDGSWVVKKIDIGNTKRIEMGHLKLDGILFRKGNMIEEDQVDGQLLDSLKERDNFNILLANTNQSIKDLESQLLEFPKTISQAKKPTIVEEAMIEKRLSDLRKQKDDLEKKLLAEEKKIKILQSQRIDNPKSAYGHPGLKAYLEQQELSKVREANEFVKKLGEERKNLEERRQKLDQEFQKKQLQEEQDKLAKEARLKIQKEKEKEENLKERIKEIAQEKTKRLQESEQHQDKYKQQTEKMNNGKSPLYMRLSKQFRSQQKLEEAQKAKHMDEVRDSHKRIDEMNLFEHQQKYLDKLKSQEEERLNEKKKMKVLMKEHLQKISSFPQSTMWNQSKEEVSFNSPQDQKLRAQKQIEARKMFSEGVLKKKHVNRDKQKELEIMINIDKLNNPGKYIKPLKRRRNSTDSKFEASEEYDKFDEKVYKKELNFERGKNNQIEKGNDYLEELKEKVKNMPRKTRSEHPLSSEDKTIDNMSEIKNGSSMLQQSVVARTKIDYMSEIRNKFNLDKKNEVKEWERVSRNYNSSDPNEKKNNLLRISKKLDDEAKHQELMYSIQKSNKQAQFSLKDVESREKIDEMYLESIKAKFAIFDEYGLQDQTGLASENHSQL